MIRQGTIITRSIKCNYVIGQPVIYSKNHICFIEHVHNFHRIGINTKSDFSGGSAIVSNLGLEEIVILEKEIKRSFVSHSTEGLDAVILMKEHDYVLKTSQWEFALQKHIQGSDQQVDFEVIVSGQTARGLTFSAALIQEDKIDHELLETILVEAIMSGPEIAAKGMNTWIKLKMKALING